MSLQLDLKSKGVGTAGTAERRPAPVLGTNVTVQMSTTAVVFAAPAFRTREVADGDPVALIFSLIPGPAIRLLVFLTRTGRSSSLVSSFGPTVRPLVADGSLPFLVLLIRTRTCCHRLTSLTSYSWHRR